MADWICRRCSVLVIAVVGIVIVAVTSTTSVKARQPAPSASAPQSQPQRPPRPRQRRPAALEPTPALDVAPLVQRGIEHIVAVQEGEANGEWPYEGVYRVRGQIPIGYRIGGTAICAQALIRAPGYTEDQERREAVARAARFIVDGCAHPLMSPDYDGGYDVRGWGYTYGLLLLLELKSRNLVPEDAADGVEKSILWQIAAIESTEITQVGGWNYARQQGRDAVSPPSPFMTGPTLQALFEAKRQGYQVNQSVIDRAIGTLEQARTPTGAIRYSGTNGAQSIEPVPGAVGRMLVTETTLYLAGKSSIANIRSAVDAFIVHWDWLEKRRAQTGTHVPPYNIAPYYFYYAHYYAAQAVEMLPERERAEYRRRITDLLMKTRAEDGTWNDRVFERSSNFGTAMAVMALLMPQSPAPARLAGAPRSRPLA